MFQDPTTTAIAYGWRTNPVSAPPLPSEGALLISGPAEVDVGVESDPFLVSFYGTIRGTLAVTLTFGGANVTPSTTSVELTFGSPTAEVTVTPSGLGAATITASAAGLDSVTDSYAVISPLPVPDFNLWEYKVDPEIAWGTNPHGTNYDGDTCKPKINLEFDAAGSDSPTNPALVNPVGFKLNSSIGTYDGSSGSPSYKAEMTATQLRLGQVTPAFPIVQRITDPGGGGFMCFKHTHDRDEHYWVNGNKWRSQFVPAGTDAEIPWGTEHWIAFALRPTTDQLLSRVSGWDMVFQMHQGSASLIKGGPLEIFLSGGDGNAANARLWFWITNYQNPNWLAGDYSNSSAYIEKVQNSTIVTPVADTWHYIIMKVREGCGYSDPTHGAIYGTVGSYSGGSDAGNAYYAKVWYAVGSGSAIQAAPEWRGHWGSPHNPAHADADNNVLVDGVLTNTINAVALPGIYQSTSLQPASAGTQRTLIHRGARAWIHQDGMTQHNVLAAFRGS